MKEQNPEHTFVNEEEMTFIITDDQGNEHEMIMVLTFDVEDTPYAVLLDKNDLEADGVIFRIEEDDESAYLVGITDEDEWSRVVAAYNEIAENMQDQEQQ